MSKRLSAPARLAFAAAFFVLPVGGNPKIRRAVHLGRADLDFQRLAGRPDDFGVQGLVAVGLRFGNIIVEPPRQRHPDLMDDAEGMITVGDSRHDDPQGDQIVNLAEIQRLLLHLVVDGIQMLGPALELGLDAFFRQPCFQHVGRRGNVFFPLRPRFVQLLFQLVVGVGIDIFEGQVFKLPLDLPDAEAVCERGEDLQRFLGDFLLPMLRHRAQRPHIVQAVGELDDHDPQVFRHRQQNFAEVRGAFVGLAVPLLAGHRFGASAAAASAGTASTRAPGSASLRASKSASFSLVTPSTRSAISSPNSAAIWSRETPQSSTTSCSSPAASVASSISSSVRIIVTARGCVIYGSPERRVWPSCFSSA